jgi:tRNA threonylcarbamoyladenosine biosynthesis protein TsaE
MELKTKDEAETRALGLELAKRLNRGAVVALIGDLGTGKTTLAKAVAEGLGVKETVTSPTFTLIREYSGGRLPFYHFDVYRIEDVNEMYELGYEDYFYDGGVCVVEWADRVLSFLPPDAVIIKIYYGGAETERRYRISPDSAVGRK